MQETHNCIYCVVDLHALAQPVSMCGSGPKELARNTREVTAAFIASGIDPKKHIVFNQSQVHEHAELTWIFNCVSRIGWLNRMTQFKEKAGKDRENASIGLYDYPVLMASDILVYRATHVPVGEDQKQHLELSRDIAQKFNNDFDESIRDLGLDRAGFNTGAFFPLPEPIITGPATRVMSLRDGTRRCRSPTRPAIGAHQSLRRCRHDCAKGAQGQDRSGSRCRRKNPASTSGRKPTTSSVSMPPFPARPSKSEVLGEFRRRAVLRTSRTRWSNSASTKLAPDRLRDEAAGRRPRPCRFQILVDGADRARADRRRDHEIRPRDIVGFVRKR